MAEWVSNRSHLSKVCSHETQLHLLEEMFCSFFSAIPVRYWAPWENPYGPDLLENGFWFIWEIEASHKTRAMFLLMRKSYHLFLSQYFAFKILRVFPTNPKSRLAQPLTVYHSFKDLLATKSTGQPCTVSICYSRDSFFVTISLPLKTPRTKNWWSVELQSLDYSWI